MTTRRLRLLSSAVLVLGAIGMVSPRNAKAATRSPLICGPVCVHQCSEAQTACEPCFWDGTCFEDPACFPFSDGIEAGCGP